MTSLVGSLDFMKNTGRVASISEARSQGAQRPVVDGLTVSERHLLLDEIAAISAELSELQERAAEIARRVTTAPSSRADRSA